MTPCKIVDMHCDTISELRKKRNMGWNEGLQSNKGHLDLERMREQGYLLQNMALFVNQGECSDPWEEFLVLEKLYREELQRNYDRVRPVFSYEDIERNERVSFCNADCGGGANLWGRERKTTADVPDGCANDDHYLELSKLPGIPCKGRRASGGTFGEKIRFILRGREWVN